MKHTLALLILTVLIVVAHASDAQAQRSLAYEPATVELEGRLVIQLKYGPPNFGEQPKTDKKLRVPVRRSRSGGFRTLPVSC
ncbi:MAG TPA: hypothetical protein VFO99_05370 [Pyrinomonadaceae bacterium]|nr:hypothetical protein [Pyrinomonadaceae bacterium]